MAPKKTKSEKKDKKYHIEFTSLSASLWAFSLFFLLAWIFIFGILVGRGSLPGAVTAIADLKDQIGKLQEIITRNKSDKLRSHKNPDPDPKLAFYEKLSSKKDEARENWVPKRKAATVKNKKPASSVEKEAAWKAPSERKKREGIEVSIKGPEPLNSREQYTVQLAAIEDRSLAEKMVRELVDKGYPAYYYDVNIRGRIYHRVRCGRFITRNEAEKYVHKLSSEVGIKGFVSKLE